MAIRAELLGGPASSGAGGGGRRQHGRVVALRFGVSVPTSTRPWRGGARRAEQARAQRSHQGPKLADQHAAIRAEVASRPDVTLDELRAWLAAEHDVSASLGLMHTPWPGWGSRAKAGRAQEQGRPDVARNALPGATNRRGCARGYLHRRDRGGHEDGAPIRPLPARPAPGLRHPARPLETTTFLAGLTGSGFLAPLVTDSAMTGPLFRAWAEQMLAPELRPGDLVIMATWPPIR